MLTYGVNVHRKLHPRNSNPSTRPRRAFAGGKPGSDVCEDRHRQLLGCVCGGETGAGGVCQWDGGRGVGGCWYVLFCLVFGGGRRGWEGERRGGEEGGRKGGGGEGWEGINRADASQGRIRASGSSYGDRAV